MKILIFTFLQFFIDSAFGQTKAVDTTPVNPNVKEIIVIFMTHLDIGYTHRVKDIVQYYRTEMIDNALNVATVISIRATPVNLRGEIMAPL